jgi:hypothetical protein
LQESSVETESQHWPELLSAIIQELTKGCQNLTLDELEEGVLLCSKLLSKLTPSTNFARDTSLSRSIASPGLSPTGSEFDPDDSIEYDSKTFKDSSEKSSPRENGIATTETHDLPRDNTDRPRDKKLESRESFESRDSFESRESFESGDVVMETRGQELGSRDHEPKSRDEEPKSRVTSRDNDEFNSENLSSEGLDYVIGERFRKPKFERNNEDINSVDVVDGTKLTEKGKDGKVLEENEGKREKGKVEASKKRERVKSDSDKRKDGKVKESKKDEKTNEPKEKHRSKKEKTKEKRKPKEKSKKDKQERPKLAMIDTKSESDKNNEEMAIKHPVDSQSMLVRKCIDHFMNFIVEFFKWKIFHTEKAMDMLANDKFTRLKEIEMRDGGSRTCAGHVHCSCSSPSRAAKTYAAMCKLLVELSCFPMQDKGTDTDGLVKKGKN